MLLDSQLDISTKIFMVLAFILALTVHEGNHAVTATALGDDTPRRAGRLSLNPMRHVDAMGLIMFVIAGFGWAWTPVNPANLRPNPRTGNAIVAAAGPLANLALAVLLSIPLRLGLELPTVPLALPLDVILQLNVHRLLYIVVSLNLLLFAFNLIPVPPLDGFTVLLGLAPPPLAPVLHQVQRLGPALLLALLIIPSLLGVDIVGLVFRPVSTAFGLPSLR